MSQNCSKSVIVSSYREKAGVDENLSPRKDKCVWFRVFNYVYLELYFNIR